MTEVLLYSKPGCCLCDEVKARLGALRSTHPFAFREVNILEDAAAFEQFHDQIPAVFIDGRKAFKYHFDEKKFLRRLRPSPLQREDTSQEG